ncbi:hypothetical protein A2311_06215 [candidate division WOR-1 bacterium RIFOXYB2_FULL_48_7]|uniref:Uncharacterized protein n=1 Tax=candidate division WOR-1 bacterium RIFOXYB2_FULL_48_7 TaxID=1802583 RepID=A0A1F4TME1_UNCSA|nr:MAG: hypothetical protein A2311_06215 [candidate division WOR-1 bacterium RIFOXYB2_FULL_48_7]
MQILGSPNINLASGKRLYALADKALADLKATHPAELGRLVDLQSEGITPDKEALPGTKERELANLQAILRVAALQGNRLPEGSVSFLDHADYFVPTPHTPPLTSASATFTGSDGKPLIATHPWQDFQFLMRSPEDILSLAEEGVAELTSNTKKPNLGTVSLGLPIAGTASRALEFASAHPELVERIRLLGGLDGLKEGELPPRYLYPVQTNAGIKTLVGIMLENAARLGRELGVIIPSILMMNNSNAHQVIHRLFGQELAHWSPEELDSSIIFTQSVAGRYYFSDLADITGQYFPTGHSDFPHLMATYRLYNFLHDQGIKYLYFGNADEIFWNIDPVMLAIAKRLIGQGYAGLTVVVPNSNNQPAGGAVKNSQDPNDQYLLENPRMPASMVSGGRYPLTLNTTFYIYSIERLMQITENLLTITPGLEVKPVKGRRGGIELSFSMEGWAGCEFSDPHHKPTGYRSAFALFPRAFVFTGVKSLLQSHSDAIPPEFAGLPGLEHMTYEMYQRHGANTYSEIIRRLVAGDRATAEALFASGYSYYLP